MVALASVEYTLKPELLNAVMFIKNCRIYLSGHIKIVAHSSLIFVYGESSNGSVFLSL